MTEVGSSENQLLFYYSLSQVRKQLNRCLKETNPPLSTHFAR